MGMNHTPIKLSAKAFSEFKTVYQHEFSGNESDADLDVIALGALKLFQILTESESKAFIPNRSLSA